MKKKILLINEFSGLNTGYAVYGRNLFLELAKTGKYELAELACYLDPRDPRGQQFPWKIYPAVPHPDNKEAVQAYNADANNHFGKLMFERVVLDFRPSIILSIKDFWMDRFIVESPLRDYYKYIYMPTVDGVPQDPEWLSMYKDCDAILTYTDWGKQVLEEYGIKVFGSAPASVEPCFRPLPKEQIKQNFGFRDCKILGFVSRNQARKQIPNLLHAFRDFLDKSQRKDIYIYLHTSNHDMGWDLAELLKEAGVSSKVILTYICKKCGFPFPNLYSDENIKCKKCGAHTSIASNVQAGVPSEILAQIYNCMDLYVQWASSEGAGFGAVEAAACGVPVIETDYSAMSDIARKLNANTIEPIALYKEITTRRLMAVPDKSVLTEKLLEFFNLPTDIQKLKGYEARQGFLTHYSSWSNTAKVWENCIDSVGNGNWEIPARLHPIAPPQQFLGSLSNSDFVKWCITNVLGEPKKLHSFFHLKAVRDLNYGFTNSVPGTYMDEQSQIFSKPQRQNFGKQEFYNLCANLANIRNQWEQIRCKS